VHDSLKRNQFGATAGGKIIKDKLYFFGGWQSTRNRSNPPQKITHIPTAAALTGDFSALASAACQSNGKAVTLYNPNNGQPFPNGNQIPRTMLNDVALTVANKYLPVSSADQCGQVTYGIPTTGDEDQWIGRVDWLHNTKHTLYGRYFVDDYQNPPVFDGKNLLTTTQAGNFERAQSATIGDNYTFGPGTLNTFHLSFNRIRDNRGPTDTPINPTLLGVNMYSAVPNFFLIGTMTGGFTTFCGTCAPGHFNVNSFQVADDVDLIRGHHQMAFGFNLIRIQNNTISGFNENGTFSFNGSLTGSTATPGCSNCGLGMADFMIGRPNDFMQTNATPDDLRQWVMSFYAQDTFKMSSRLTLNFGVRWEPTFSDPDKYGRGTSFSLAGFNAGQHSTVNPNAPAGLFFKGDPGIPDAMWNGHRANFAPRVGLVWNPHGDSRDSLRIGAALLYDSTETWFNERETTNPPYGTNIDVVNPPGGLSDPWRGFPGGNPFPTNGRAIFPSAGVYVNMPIDPKPTYVAQWNITYQRQFAGSWLASASFLGNHTTHLWIAGEVNPAQFLGTGPCAINNINYSTCSTTGNTNQRRVLYLANPAAGASYASIDTMDDGAVSRYAGLLLSVQHRLNHGFSFNANYTDSYCLSDFDFGAALATSTNSQRFNRHADWGPCISDTRHNFNTSVVYASSWKGGSPWVSRLLSDWQVTPLLHVASGQPLGGTAPNVTTGKDQSLSGLNNDRPVQILPDPLASSHGCATTSPCYQWINPSAFTPNAIGAYGTLGRNAIRGPGNVNLDLGLIRMFKITERFSVQARAEAFNILNHTNFVGSISPAGGATYNMLTVNLSSSTFGQPQAAFDPRILQFALKVFF